MIKNKLNIENKENTTKNINYCNISSKNIHIFKEKVNKIFFKNSQNTENFLTIEKLTSFIDSKLRESVREFIINSQFSFFKNYKNKNWEIDENRISTKLDKYFPIHQNIFYQVLIEEIEKLPENSRNQQNINNLIRNNIEKYLYILFIFSEKVKLSDLENLLKAPLSNISEKYVIARNDISLLENFEKEESEKMKDFYKIEANTISENFVNESFISSMYRHIYREIAKNNEEKNTWNQISEKIEETYQTTIEKIFYIFTIWAESGYQKTEERFLNIEITIRKLLNWIIFLKNNAIAFENFPTNKINEKFFSEIFNKFLINHHNDYRAVFTIFVKNIFEKNPEKKEQKLQEINKKLQEISRNKTRNREIAKTQYQEDLDIESVNFYNWEKVPENQKYENVFSKVIAENGKIKLADFLNLNWEEFNNSFELFFKFHELKNWIKNYNDSENFRNSLLNQAEEIRNFEWKTVEEFINYDVNNLNFLILWWRNILKIRINNKYDLFELVQINEKIYWVVEKIIENEKIKKIIETWRIELDPDWRIKNTSVKGSNTLLMDLLKWLKKWFINLKQDSITLTNGKQKVISKIRDLYLPVLSENDTNPENNILLIENYINNWIDLCFNLLKWSQPENKEQKSYLEMMINKGILKDENLWKEDLEKIQNLVEVLKFIKNRIRHIKTMLEIAEKDKKILMENKEIWSLLNNQYSGFGPKKSFARAFEKLVADYGGDFNRLGDLTRLRIIGEDIDDVSKKITDFIEASNEVSEISHIAISDKTWEPISIPTEKSGYRDIKLLLKMNSWNTVEVQFHYREMFEVKTIGLDLTLEENKNILLKMKKENKLLKTEEMQELLKHCKKREIELPKKEILQNLLENPNSEINWQEYEYLLNKTKISTDYTYHIIRQLDENNPIREKLTRLERVLADSAWSKIVIQYLKKRNIQIN